MAENSQSRIPCNKSALVTRRHNRRETTGWVSKLNRVLPERRVVNLKLGPVAIDRHGIGIAIDRDDDLLARVARVGEGKLGPQSVAGAIGLTDRLERNQVFAWDASTTTFTTVVHDDREVLIKRRTVSRHAVARDICCGHLNREGSTYTGG